MNFRQKIISIVIALAAMCAMAAVIFVSGIEAQYDFAEGDVCTTDIFAPRAITDEVATKARRAAAAAAIPERYAIDTDAAKRAADSMSDFMSAAYAVRESENTYLSAREDMLRSESKLNLSDAIYAQVCTMAEEDFVMLGKAPAIVREVMEAGVEDVDEAVALCTARFEEENFSMLTVNVAAAIAGAVIEVNKSVDEELTERERNAAAAAVDAVEYRRNQIIARRGEVLTAGQIELLRQLGYIAGTAHISKRYILGVGLLLAFFFVTAYIYARVCAMRKALTLTGITITCIVGVLCSAMTLLYPRDVQSWLVYAMPFIICPVLLGVLIEVRWAIAVNICVSTVCAIALDEEWGYALMLILAGAFAALVFSYIKRRVHLIPAAVVSAAAYAGIFAVFALIENADNATALRIMATGFLGALAGGCVLIGTLPLWEALFDVSTPLKLGELAHPEHKLQKRLLLEAPGTYHHSLTVANMCEAAAREIGANVLLARVGAYYHDVGKLKNPLYFGENVCGENPHDALESVTSARVIRDHVAEGVEIAKKYRLPSDVRNIIEQHHGTTVIAYFLHKARESGADVDEADFRYNGPKPASREAAIVLLADSCEAAVRSMRDKSPDAVDKMVKKIVAEKIADLQLDESFITFRDVDAVTKSFSATLRNYMHGRIEYPK